MGITVGTVEAAQTPTRKIKQTASLSHLQVVVYEQTVVFGVGKA